MDEVQSEFIAYLSWHFFRTSLIACLWMVCSFRNSCLIIV